MAACGRPARTFLVFTDYARPAIRIAALAGIPADLRDDARLDRPRRGRADAPAGRASCGACAPCRTCASSAPPTRSRPPNAGSSRSSAATGRPLLALTRQTLPQLRPRRGDGEPAAPPAPTRSRRPTARPRRRSSPRARRSRSRSRAQTLLAGARHAGPRRLGALARPVPQPSRRPCAAAIVGDAPVKVAVEAAVRFGWDAADRRRRPLRRHEGFRGERALQGPLPAFRNHGRGGRRPGAAPNR